MLDLNRTDAVDRHDPPPWMREQVILRDRHCVFPWCGRDARLSDLDHIVPYVPPDEGGPPGQTNPQNLAPLCRRHHRAKTFTGWTYQRDRDGTYTWTSPHGRTCTVGPDGTTRTTLRARPHPTPRTEPRRTRSPPDADARAPMRARSARASPVLGWQSGVMADSPAPPATGHGEHLLELRKEAFTMALYVAICLLAALIALPERAAEPTSMMGVIWGITLGLAIRHWFAFRVSARLVGAGAVRLADVRSAGAQQTRCG